MEKINFNYKKSTNIKNNNDLLLGVKNTILTDNKSEFNYLSLSVRNHKMNLATSLPSNKEIVETYVKRNLIDIDPLSCFELFTKKKLVTYSEFKRYQNHGKCGLSFVKEREKSGILKALHYIHRTGNWSLTVVLGTDYKKNGFAQEEELIQKNALWINRVIQRSLDMLNKNKCRLIGFKIKFSFKVKNRKIKIKKNDKLIFVMNNSQLLM